jgi:Raf kinase inhibitor-like YbhB/YbcL family protein
MEALLEEKMKMKMKTIQRTVLSAIAITASCAMVMAQAPGGGKGGGKGPGGPPRPVLSVTSPAWPDGGEVPMKNAGRGENKSPEFEFHWTAGNNPVAAPEGLQSYAIIFHDIENSTNKTTVDTLHWSAFNIPGTAKGLPEGLGSGDLPDGTRNGPGIAAGRGAPAYFGPGAGPGPFHHYVFEFYALDTKLNLPANTTRDELMKAMDGHVIGKAAYVGRFHAPPQ